MIFHLRSVRAKHLLRQFMLFNSTDQANIHKKVLGNSSGKANTEMERTIAIGQMCATNDKLANRQQVQLIVESAVEQRACFVFLPECCDYVGTNKDETIALAEPLDGTTVAFYKELAKKHNIWLSLGGLHESIFSETNEKTDRIHNAHVIISNRGELNAVYRKLHLYDVDTTEFKFRESSVVDGGRQLVKPLRDTPLHGLGLLMCYDVRFPEVSTLLRKNGAHILTYPSAFSYPTGIAHWEPLLRSRAIENQCFVIAAAQIGYHNEKRRSYGHAMVVDPWGKILVECDDKLEPQCRSVTISMDSIEPIRQRMPCFEHRRNNVYTLNPIQMIAPEKSIAPIKNEFSAIAVEEEKSPYFIFEKYPVDRSTTFYETPLSIAFTNISCVLPGHVLIATRRCVSRLKDLTSDEVVDFFLVVHKIQRALETYYGTTSSTVTVQDGEQAGQTVKHVHCHIMPRRDGDFEHNDQIYIELNRHDHLDSQKPRRSLEERTAEANEYRKLLGTFE